MFKQLLFLSLATFTLAGCGFSFGFDSTEDTQIDNIINTLTGAEWELDRVSLNGQDVSFQAATYFFEANNTGLALNTAGQPSSFNYYVYFSGDDPFIEFSNFSGTTQRQLIHYSEDEIVWLIVGVSDFTIFYLNRKS